MTLSIRDATEADLPAILAIFNHAIVHTTAVWTLTPVTLDNRRAWLRDRTAQGFPVLVAEADGDVAGFASYGVFRAFEGFRHTVEHSVYVRENARGHGIGRMLLNALVDHAEAHDIHVMIGAIDAENSASVALHKSSGFVEAGVLRESGRKFGRWLDMLSMQKILGNAGRP
jgi:phosphinothricin acetyltransferase